MKIAQITPVYPPYLGGIGNVAREYATRLIKRGQEVVVFTPRYLTEPAWRREDGVQVCTRRGVITLGKAAVLPSLIWLLRNFDILHLQYPFYGADVFVAIASWLWKKPLIITYHMKTKDRGLKGLTFILHRIFIEPLVLRRAKMVLVSSIEYAKSINLKHPRLTEMPFGVDEQRFCAGSSPVRASLNIKPESTVFIFVGGLDSAHYFKGVDIMLCAAARLSRNRQWDILIVGSGNCLDDYKNLAKELNIEERVHFIGKVPPVELADYYRAADVHLLPSVDRSEAFGLVTLEAAASGLPSIVSDLPGVRLLVISGETGLRVSPGDVTSLTSAMNFFIDQPSKRQEFGQNARHRVEEIYSHNRRLDELLQIYSASKVVQNKL